LPIPKDSILRTPSAARSSRQTCSTSRPVGLARPVVVGQFMWLSAINGRPERRSDDGRMILRAARADQKLRFDLLFCGAPLRNRTVDLLLTMNHRTVPLPLVQRVTRQDTSTYQHPQAPDGPSRARFAPRSAPQFDLAAIGVDRCRPAVGGSCAQPLPSRIPAGSPAMSVAIRRCPGTSQEALRWHLRFSMTNTCRPWQSATRLRRSGPFGRLFTERAALPTELHRWETRCIVAHLGLDVLIPTMTCGVIVESAARWTRVMPEVARSGAPGR